MDSVSSYLRWNNKLFTKPLHHVAFYNLKKKINYHQNMIKLHAEYPFWQGSRRAVSGRAGHRGGDRHQSSLAVLKLSLPSVLHRELKLKWTFLSPTVDIKGEAMEQTKRLCCVLVTTFHILSIE